MLRPFESLTEWSACSACPVCPAAAIQNALILYRERMGRNPMDIESILGYMTCLDALGEWDELVDMCNRDSEALMGKDVDPATREWAASLATR